MPLLRQGLLQSRQSRLEKRSEYCPTLLRSLRFDVAQPLHVVRDGIVRTGLGEPKVDYTA